MLLSNIRHQFLKGGFSQIYVISSLNALAKQDKKQERINNIIILNPLGFKDIEVIDLDTIDVSNLNRQFLFQKQHVGKSKSNVAQESALRFAPDAKIKVYNIGFCMQGCIFSLKIFFPFSSLLKITPQPPEVRYKPRKIFLAELGNINTLLDKKHFFLNLQNHSQILKNSQPYSNDQKGGVGGGYA